MINNRARYTTLALLAFSAVSLAQRMPGNLESMTAQRLRSHLEFIASDELEGRNTPSRGLDIAAKYIAAHLSLWGVKPGGDNGTYFQKFAIRRPSVSATGSTLTLAGTKLAYGTDFYARALAGKAEGPVVFVGNGWHLPDKPGDPYAKVDVKGKILLAYTGVPAGGANTGAVSIQNAARKFGATGVILISSASADDFKQAANRSTQGGGGRGGQLTVPTITIRAEALKPLLDGERLDYATLEKLSASTDAAEPVALSAAKTVSLQVASEDNAQWTQNVIGIIEGTDPKLKSEYVALGAHYDHIGMRETGEGDRISNGADDDGSGTVSLLEMAHAFQMSRQKPKRSIIIIWHAGEERGLLGSRHYVANPTVPLKDIIAQLNIDMIGRTKQPGMDEAANKMLSAPGSIYIVGTTRMSSELGPWAIDVNKKLYNLKYDFTYDDVNHPERIFFRSDHYSFAEKGIPILFWFDGVHEDYHRVSDEVDKIDFAQMEKVARTVGATAWDLANRRNRPKADIPLQAPGR